jgi:hypothetical protein
MKREKEEMEKKAFAFCTGYLVDWNAQRVGGTNPPPTIYS